MYRLAWVCPNLVNGHFLVETIEKYSFVVVKFSQLYILMELYGIGINMV